MLIKVYNIFVPKTNFYQPSC